jgi:hypothetical protein
MGGEGDVGLVGEQVERFGQVPRPDEKVSTCLAIEESRTMSARALCYLQVAGERQGGNVLA